MDKGMDKEKGENGITWDKDFKRKAFNKNINDFITTIRTRKEPEINSLDGMAGIAFNLAVLESAKSGKIISLMVE
jgi:predicted dehydrogenase